MAEMIPIKERMQRDQVLMPEQDPQIRGHNFNEVPTGYTKEMAIYEAQRCLQCTPPKCVEGCPAEVHISEFIKKIVEEDFAGAYFEILKTNNLPAVCGRVCPQETQCGETCILDKKGKPVAIGRLARFVSDWARENDVHEKLPEINKKGKNVAVIGAGPAGLVCAADLQKMGYDVTIFEAFHASGGVLVYGIPEFRLPKEIVRYEAGEIEKLGVKFETDFVAGKTKSIPDMAKEFDAMFIAIGAGAPRFMEIPGENLAMVYSANEFLTRSNLMKAYRFPEYDTPIKIGRKVCTIGAGNVSMDSARTALRLGAEISHIVYRRSRKEAPARIEEVEHAEEEGVVLNFLTLPIKVLGNYETGEVTGMECIKMELGEPDESGRRRPIPVEGTNFIIEADMVIDSIGTLANPIVPRSAAELGVEINKWGYFVFDEETMQTTREGIFCGGDIARGAATVILAVGDGKKGARGVDKYLSSGNSLKASLNK